MVIWDPLTDETRGAANSGGLILAV